MQMKGRQVPIKLFIGRQRAFFYIVPTLDQNHPIYYNNNNTNTNNDNINDSDNDTNNNGL